MAPLAIAASAPSEGIFSFTQHAGCSGVQKNPGAIAFTFTNGYYSWVSAIFVDVRDSSTLFADEDKEKTRIGF